MMTPEEDLKYANSSNWPVMIECCLVQILSRLTKFIVHALLNIPNVS